MDWGCLQGVVDKGDELFHCVDLTGNTVQKRPAKETNKNDQKDGQEPRNKCCVCHQSIVMIYQQGKITEDTGSYQTRQCRTQSCTRWSVWFWKNHSIFAYSRPLYSFPSRHKKPMPGIKAAWNWRQSKNVTLQHKTGTILIRLVQQGKTQVSDGCLVFTKQK